MSNELSLINQFFSYYPQGAGYVNEPLCALSPYEATAWAGTAYPDTGYYRALLHNAVAGLILNERILNKDRVNLTRLLTLYQRVLSHYAHGPDNNQSGWGFFWGDSTAGALGARQLTAHTDFVGSPLALATALFWPYLSWEDRLQAKTLLRNFADRLLSWRTQTYYNSLQSIDNTLSEEAAACASFLALMSQFDPSYPNASSWLARAKLLMTWAYANSFARRLVPPNDLNQHPANYAGTLANHNMFPHPLYGFSLLVESALAVLPWAASGGAERVHLSLPALYGSSAAHAYTVYVNNLAFVNGCSNTGVLAPTTTRRLRGYTYPANQLSWSSTPPQPKPFALISYDCSGLTPAAGCSDWGGGIDFQNAAFALVAWLDETFYPSLGIGYYNYQTILATQENDPGCGYLPTNFVNGNWQWAYLPTTLGGSMPTDGTRPLLNFFYPAGSFPPLTLAGQINTHYFINSYTAYNHAVAWLLRSSYWNVTLGGKPLPNFKD